MEQEEETDVQKAYEELKHLRRALRREPDNVEIIKQIQVILKWLEENE